MELKEEQAVSSGLPGFVLLAIGAAALVGLSWASSDSESLAQTAKKLDPEKWEKAKKDAVRKMGGVHSARAMQYAVQLYKERGGRYVGRKTGKEGLSLWTKEKWQTRPGTDPIAKRGKVTARYLPEKAWETLSPSERVATDVKKQRACKKGEKSCYISNTPAAKKAGKKARKKR